MTKPYQSSSSSNPTPPLEIIATTEHTAEITTNQQVTMKPTESGHGNQQQVTQTDGIDMDATTSSVDESMQGSTVANLIKPTMKSVKATTEHRTTKRQVVFTPTHTPWSQWKTTIASSIILTTIIQSVLANYTNITNSTQSANYSSSTTPVPYVTSTLQLNISNITNTTQPNQNGTIPLVETTTLPYNNSTDTKNPILNGNSTLFPSNGTNITSDTNSTIERVDNRTKHTTVIETVENIATSQVPIEDDDYGFFDNPAMIAIPVGVVLGAPVVYCLYHIIKAYLASRPKKKVHPQSQQSRYVKRSTGRDQGVA